mmetsp:Transcript_91559/g.254985  ORF Transcript_91559/g.254985 Transcript_91559/m.254985 type:complete len:230 (+) Transcript_91559:749-1438(+)
MNNHVPENAAWILTAIRTHDEAIHERQQPSQRLALGVPCPGQEREQPGLDQVNEVITSIELEENLNQAGPEPCDDAHYAMRVFGQPLAVLREVLVQLEAPVEAHHDSEGNSFMLKDCKCESNKLSKVRLIAQPRFPHSEAYQNTFQHVAPRGCLFWILWQVVIGLPRQLRVQCLGDPVFHGNRCLLAKELVVAYLQLFVLNMRVPKGLVVLHSDEAQPSLEFGATRSVG